jgi:hypothetical protein
LPSVVPIALGGDTAAFAAAVHKVCPLNIHFTPGPVGWRPHPAAFALRAAFYNSFRREGTVDIMGNHINPGSAWTQCENVTVKDRSMRIVVDEVGHNSCCCQFLECPHIQIIPQPRRLVLSDVLYHFTPPHYAKLARLLGNGGVAYWAAHCFEEGFKTDNYLSAFRVSVSDGIVTMVSRDSNGPTQPVRYVHPLFAPKEILWRGGGLALCCLIDWSVERYCVGRLFVTPDEGLVAPTGTIPSDNYDIDGEQLPKIAVDKLVSRMRRKMARELEPSVSACHGFWDQTGVEPPWNTPQYEKQWGKWFPFAYMKAKQIIENENLTINALGFTEWWSRTKEKARAAAVAATKTAGPLIPYVIGGAAVLAAYKLLHHFRLCSVFASIQEVTQRIPRALTQVGKTLLSKLDVAERWNVVAKSWNEIIQIIYPIFGAPFVEEPLKRWLINYMHPWLVSFGFGFMDVASTPGPASMHAVVAGTVVGGCKHRLFVGLPLSYGIAVHMLHNALGIAFMHYRGTWNAYAQGTPLCEQWVNTSSGGNCQPAH